MSTTTAARFAANTSDRRQERNTGIQNPKRDRGFESGVLEVIRGGLGVLAHPSGTDGSNPVPSSAESIANLNFREVLWALAAVLWSAACHHRHHRPVGRGRSASPRQTHWPFSRRNAGLSSCYQC